MLNMPHLIKTASTTDYKKFPNRIWIIISAFDSYAKTFEAFVNTSSHKTTADLEIDLLMQMVIACFKWNS